MSSLADVGIPGVGTGILQPNLAYKFRVRIVENDVQYNELSMQVVSTSDFGYWSSQYGGHRLTVVFQDDVTNQAARRLVDLHARGAKIDVFVDILDGNDTVTRTHAFNDAVIAGDLVFSPLDYAGGGSPEQFVFNSNNRDDNPLRTMLSGSRVEFYKRDHKTGVNTITATFFAQQYQVLFPQPTKE
jgi:hypothetical protein